MFSVSKMNSLFLAIAIIANCVHSSPGIPHKIDINVPCVNATSNCGYNGVCHTSGPVYSCKCDSGYSTIDINDPCAAKGEAQSKMAVLTYFFGWSGATAFMLGWTVWGIVVLMLFCCGVCCTLHAKENENPATGCWGILCTLAFVGVWWYLAITISLNNCVDDKGVACKSW